jgi:hypothetical protein
MAGLGITDNSGDVNGLAVNTRHQALVVLETDTVNASATIGAVRAFSENDPGLALGSPQLLSPETDLDYRQRSAEDTMMDDENMDYTAQNTGKHTMTATTFVPAWTMGAFQTNPTGILTATTGVTFGTYAVFPIMGANITALDVEASFSALCPANVTLDFGLFTRGSATSYTPADGVYIRYTSAGLRGVMNFNGNETVSPIFLAPTANASILPTVAWAPTINTNYQFIVYVSARMVEFWINQNGVVFLAGSMQTPSGYGAPCATESQPFSIRQANVGAAGAAFSFNLSH